MPNASLLVMTSPMLMGPVPTIAAADVLANAPVPIVAEAAIAPVSAPLAISWSLTAVQNTRDTTQPSENDPPAEADEAQSDPEGEREIIVEGEYGPVRNDPVGQINETSYRITQNLDRALVEPVAYAYRDGLPDPLRDGLGNVVRNLREPANFLNFLLQGKVGKAFETVGRFAINSTLGLGGIIDIAEKPGINLPYRRNGFANTMGFYGVGSGAYLYLPVAGATSVRDVIGDALDQFVLPVAVGRPFNTPGYAAPYFVVSNLDTRLEVDEELQRIGETIDPYAARRDTYLYRREREIALLRGKEPPEPPAILREIEGGDELLEEELDEAAPSEATPDSPMPDAPGISYEDVFETPRMAIAITKPLTR